MKQQRFLSLRRVLSWALCLTMALSLVPAARAADQPAVSSNINAQDYSRWSDTVKSYLYANPSGGLTRVEYINSSIVVEDYDSAFRLQSSRTVPMELSIWGGFYAGGDANYLIFGQANPSQSDATEVIRVVKYSKDWQRQGQASLCGANTTVPFDAGSLRCDEYGGYLYIRTCHEMYTSPRDGLNHQANVTMAVRESDMTITDSYYEVMNADYGYVSHSFNQFILIDEDGYIVALDHGDAYPRGVNFTRYYANAGTGKFSGSGYGAWCSNGVMQEFAGATGDNTTGATVGGLAETATHYIFAYSYDGQGGGGDRHPYLHYMDKATGRSWQAAVGPNIACSAPMLAPTGLQGGYMLWNGKGTDTLYYLAYGEDGQPGQVQTATAPLSDCQPIPYDGGVVWYVTNNSAPTFYTLNGSGVAAHPAGQVGTSEAPSTPETPSTPSTPVNPETPSAGGRWSGVVSDQNMTFDRWGAVMADGTLRVWENHDYYGSNGTSYEPTDMDAGYKAAAIWSNGQGYLLKADGTLEMLDNPADLQYIFADDTNVEEISRTRGLVLKKDGTAWHYDEQVASDVKQIYAGYSWYAGEYYYILKNDGSLWSWAEDELPNLPDPMLGRNQGRGGKTMGKIMDGVAYVTGGMAIKTDGSLWTWGIKWSVGNGTGEDAFAPVKLLDNVVGAWSYEASPFENLRYALTASGELYSWGSCGKKDSWALGYQNPDSEGVYVEEYADLNWRSESPVYYQSKPRKVDIDNAVAVYAKRETLIVQKADGSLWAIGDVGSLPCRTGPGGEEEIAASFRKVMDGVMLPGNAASASSGSSNTPSTPNTSSVSATPTSATVLVNGEQVAFDAYNIGGNNYFKLRDLAFVLNGTAKQFEVGWDSASKTITLTSGRRYTAVGGEMSAKGSGSQSAVPTGSKLLVDGREVSFTAYNIGGNNYFKLRDIGQLFDFGVGWDGATRTVTIDTSAHYTP